MDGIIESLKMNTQRGWKEIGTDGREETRRYGMKKKVPSGVGTLKRR